MKKKESNLDAAKLVEEQQTILRNHFERNLKLETKTTRQVVVGKFYTKKDCLPYLKIETKSLYPV